MAEELVFEEVQELPWPWTALGLGSCAVSGLGAAARLGLLARLGAAGIAVAAAGAVAGAFLVPMQTRLSEEEVVVTFGKWTRFRIPLARISHAEARRYSPILEYGGWGIRFSGAGRAYNMRGDRGVQLVLDDGGCILIGSQRSEELATAIQARIGRVDGPDAPAVNGSADLHE